MASEPAKGFDAQPILRGSLIELRPLREVDFADLYAAASDPGVWAQHPASDRHEESVFRAFFEDALASGGALLARDIESRVVVGTSRFHGHDPVKREVEIGWTFLARSHWGGDFNGEMKRLMLDHAFRWVDSVILLIAPENRRSQRAAEKIGAKREGTDAEGRVLFRIRRRVWRAAQPEAAAESAGAGLGSPPAMNSST